MISPKATYNTVLIGGDFNMRPGAFEYSHAQQPAGDEDAAAGASSVTGRAASVVAAADAKPAAPVEVVQRTYTRRTADLDFALSGGRSYTSSSLCSPPHVPRVRWLWARSGWLLHL